MGFGRLLPVGVACAAVALALSTGSVDAADGGAGTPAQAGSQGRDASPTDRPGGAVGSGRENYYVPQDATPADLANPVEYGRSLYVQGCSTCHGLNGEGASDADEDFPPLIGVGAAAVDFYVSTGRMPVNKPMQQYPRKTPVYNGEQVKALAAYITTLSDKVGIPAGPDVPRVHPEQGNLAAGNQLYANNCASCHNSQGSGGALGQNYYAPRLDAATDVQIAEAIRIGPGAMPVYGPNTFSEEEVNSIVKYVGSLQDAENPGGLPLGGTGPVPEGFFAWFVGLGALLAVARWIGTRV